METTTRWISGPTETTAEKVDFDPSRLTRLEEIFSGLLDTGKVQCASSSLSRAGKVFASRSIGPRQEGGSQPMRHDSWRRIASVTKALTTLGILKLVEDGRVFLEFPVSHVLPEFDTPTHKSITIRQLLTHSSGLPADPGYHLEPNADHAGFWTILYGSGWLERVAELPLAHRPDEMWCYCSIGFAVLGEVIARTVGEPYSVWMEREILEPAGLRDTFFDTTGRDIDNFCLTTDQDRQSVLKRSEVLHHSRCALGFAFSTCPDLVRLGNLFLQGGTLDGRRVVGRKTIEAICRTHIEAPAPHWGDHFPDWQYGLGLEPARHPLIRTGTVWGHEGSGRCAWWLVPEENLVAAWTLPTTLDWDPDFCWSPRAVVLSGLR